MIPSETQVMHPSTRRPPGLLLREDLRGDAAVLGAGGLSDLFRRSVPEPHGVSGEVADRSVARSGPNEVLAVLLQF